MFADDPTRLGHILDLAKEALELGRVYKREDLDNNRMLFHSVKDCLETIGEAAYKLTTDFKLAHPEVDWRSLTRLRNELIHDYFALDLDQMWDTIEDVLPDLVPEIERLMLEYPKAT